LFERYRVSGTWATVGFLFASSRRELEMFRPAILPAYANSRLNPYDEPVGTGEEEDPLHYAASLIERIRQYPDQEIATHTFSHFCCLEPGQTQAAFEADLDSAIAIARKRGVELSSIVFPRNQVNASYKQMLLAKGIVSYRGCERGWMHRPIPQRQTNIALRASRLVDSYVRVSAPKVVPWPEIPEPNGLCNVRASRFLRPVRSGWKRLEQLRLQQIKAEMDAAAAEHRIFHLWVHPHNFGANIEDNLSFLEAILEHFVHCRDRYGMSSLSMLGVAQHVLGRRSAASPTVEHRFNSALPIHPAQSPA